MNKLVAMTIMDRPEGTLIAYTYSVLDITGNILQQNVLDSFYVQDADVLADIALIKTSVNTRLNPTVVNTPTATTSSADTTVIGTTSATVK